LTSTDISTTAVVVSYAAAPPLVPGSGGGRWDFIVEEGIFGNYYLNPNLHPSYAATAKQPIAP
jgi:hypothetical protein